MVVGDQRVRAERALRSILDQVHDNAEVLVVDLAERNREPLPCYGHPAVRVLTMPRGAHFGDARAAGALAATAPIVAFIEEHCFASEGWLDAVIAAFREDWDAIGYEIHNGNPGAGVSDSCYMLSYARWAPPARATSTTLLPAMNVAFRRDALHEYRDRLSELLIFDTSLYAMLVRNGRRLAVVPAARIRHFNEPDLATAIWGNMLCHRVMACSRSALFSWSGPKRWMHALSAPLVPWYRLARMTAGILIRQPSHLVQWLAAIPVFLVCAHAAAFGKAAGLVAGPGDAAARFTRLELCSARLPDDTGYPE